MYRGLRIGFTGAGGTGKTTSANDIGRTYAELHDIPVLKSASRIAYEEGNLSEKLVVETFTPERRWELQERIFNLKVEMDDYTPEFIADRTLLDHWAYCLMYCAADMPRDKFNAMEALVRKHMLAAYSHVFYFPWGYFEAPDDGVRQSNSAWQYAIDSIILGRMIAWGIPAVEVPQTRGEDYRSEFIYHTIMGADVDREGRANAV